MAMFFFAIRAVSRATAQPSRQDSTRDTRGSSTMERVKNSHPAAVMPIWTCHTTAVGTMTTRIITNA